MPGGKPRRAQLRLSKKWPCHFFDRQKGKARILRAFCLGAPAEIRTPDTLLKRQVLYLLSYWGKYMRGIYINSLPEASHIGRGHSKAGRGRKGDGLRRSKLSSAEGSAGRKKSGDVAGMAGLEPTISESKSGVLPLHYIPMCRWTF